MKARYLVRFDDICPTMNWRVWTEVEKSLIETGIKPILAVVPDNQDEYLKVDVADEGFWERVRGWQARGWAIAVHGYQHVYVTNQAGIIGLNDRSEFAGLPAAEQERKLRDALDIFEREDIRAEIWVAPSHSFDAMTVSIAAQMGLRIISDGLSLFPHVDPGGVLWIPQQLWRFRYVPFGVWTVCCHPNAWTTDQLTGFRRDLRKYREQIVDLQTIVNEYRNRRRSLLDVMTSPVGLTLLRGKRGMRQLLRSTRNPLVRR
jgi:hypothetical protein